MGRSPCNALMSLSAAFSPSKCSTTSCLPFLHRHDLASKKKEQVQDASDSDILRLTKKASICNASFLILETPKGSPQFCRDQEAEAAERLLLTHPSTWPCQPVPTQHDETSRTIIRAGW